MEGELILEKEVAERDENSLGSDPERNLMKGERWRESDGGGE